MGFLCVPRPWRVIIGNSEGEGILKANIFKGKSEIQLEYPKGQGQEREIKTKKENPK